MSWNYRVMKRKNESGDYDFGVHEVYYDENGNVISWTEKSIIPVCPSEEGLAHELSLMLDALKQETLIYIED